MNNSEIREQLIAAKDADEVISISEGEVADKSEHMVQYFFGN